MADSQLAIISKMAQTVNPQSESARKLEIDREKFCQLSAKTLVREVARFLGNQGFEPIESRNRMQRSSDNLHVFTGLAPSGKEEIALQAFTCDRTFRSSRTILALMSELRGRCRLRQIIAKFNNAIEVDRPLNLDG